MNVQRSNHSRVRSEAASKERTDRQLPNESAASSPPYADRRYRHHERWRWPRTPRKPRLNLTPPTKFLGRDGILAGNERPKLTRDIFDGFARMRDLALEARIATTLPALVIANTSPARAASCQGTYAADSCASRRATARARHELLDGAIRDDVQRDAS